MFRNCLISGERDLPAPRTPAASLVRPRAVSQDALAPWFRAIGLNYESACAAALSRKLCKGRGLLAQGAIVRSGFASAVFGRRVSCSRAARLIGGLEAASRFIVVASGRISGLFNAPRRRGSCPGSLPPRRTRRRCARSVPPGCGRRPRGSPADRMRSPPPPCPRRPVF